MIQLEENPESLLIRYVSLDSIHQDPANVNTHTETDLGEIAKSLHTFGQRTPIVINGAGMILKGNGTYIAAKALGWETIAVLDYIASETDQLLYAIADNATGRLSRFDPERLRGVVKDNPHIPGIIEVQRAEILAEVISRRELPGECFDAAAAVEANPDATRVQTGEIYRMGRHFLICGDATDPDTVASLIHAYKGPPPTLVIADPPYGVDLDGRNDALNAQPEAKGSKSIRTHIDGDTLEGDALKSLITTALMNCASVSKSGASIYVTAPQGENLAVFMAAFQGSGFKFKWQLVWRKDVQCWGRADYAFQHENILFGWNQDAAHYFESKGKSSLFEIARPGRSTEHASMKPVDLFRKFMQHSSRPGETVLDPFAGSGTTALAAEGEGRRALLMEKEPGHCNTVIARWEALTGSQAELVEEN